MPPVSKLPFLNCITDVLFMHVPETKHVYIYTCIYTHAHTNLEWQIFFYQFIVIYVTGKYCYQLKTFRKAKFRSHRNAKFNFQWNSTINWILLKFKIVQIFFKHLLHSDWNMYCIPNVHLFYYINLRVLAARLKELQAIQKKIPNKIQAQFFTPKGWYVLKLGLRDRAIIFTESFLHKIWQL